MSVSSRIRRLAAGILCCALALSGCGAKADHSQNASAESLDSVQQDSTTDVKRQYTGLDDSDLLLHTEDAVGAALDSQLGEDYRVDSVSVSYVSREYLEELSYNSKENIYFGYTLSQIEAQFDGKPYVFTLGDNGETVAQEVRAEDDTFSEVMQDVAIGAGVILLTATVAVATKNTAIGLLLAVSAKSAAVLGTSSGILEGAAAGVVKYVETGDTKDSLKTAAVSGAEGLKWGAIGGAIAGGASKALTYRRIKAVPTWRQSEQRTLKKYGGEEQVSFLNGKKVARATKGATRPDVVRTVDGHIEAIETKNYDLENNYSGLCGTLKKEVSARNTALPKGSTQRIVLDVKGRGYSSKLINATKQSLRSSCLVDIYRNIPIDVMK